MKPRAQKMDCPWCGHWDSTIKDSRGNAQSVWRIRICQKCGCQFDTDERPLEIRAAGKPSLKLAGAGR